MRAPAVPYRVPEPRRRTDHRDDLWLLVMLAVSLLATVGLFANAG